MQDSMLQSQVPEFKTHLVLGASTSFCTTTALRGSKPIAHILRARGAGCSPNAEAQHTRMIQIALRGHKRARRPWSGDRTTE